MFVWLHHSKQKKRAKEINASLFQHFLSKVNFGLDIFVQSCTEWGVLWNTVNELVEICSIY